MKLLLVTAGCVSLLLGIVGIFLPLLPTTPFLLLSAACFMKSSDRMYGWLLNHRYLGRHIRLYMEKKAVTVRTKVSALVFLWVSIGISVAVLELDHYLVALLAIVAIIVTIHIGRLKTGR